jgi:hypothetical protein
MTSTGFDPSSPAPSTSAAIPSADVGDSLEKMRAADYIKSINKEEVRAPNLTRVERVVHKVLNALFRRRDIVIEGELYLRRWYITPRSWPKRVFLHCILRPDEERDLHDHPWNFRTIVLKNGYDEVYYGRQHLRQRNNALLERRDGKLLGRASDGWLHDVVKLGERMVLLRERDYRRLTLFRTVFNRAEHAHAVKPFDDKATWSLVIASQARKEWGFITENGWVPWRQYLGLSPDTPDHPEDTVVDV